MHTIALATHDEPLQENLKQLSAKYGLPITDDCDHYDYLLLYTMTEEPPGYICKLHSCKQLKDADLIIDYCSGAIAHRMRFGGGRKQPMARAAGIKPGHNPAILDVTGGLGRDAFILAALGCTVTLVERNPVVYELLYNACQRALANENCTDAANRMQIIHSDSGDYIASTAELRNFDTIYMDPMYPQRSKSALVKKEMQYFHDIVGRDDDAAGLFSRVLELPVKRIVIKRPKTADPLGDARPTTSISSKNTRYDIYLKHQ